MDMNRNSSRIDDYLISHGFSDYSSIIFSKDGNILYEKYHDNYHFKKNQDISFLISGIIGLLTGIAIDRHYIKSVEVPIYKVLPEFDLKKDHLHRVIKIKHLLSMTSGILWSSSNFWLKPIYYDLLYSGNPAEAISNILVAEVPGLHYCYKEWDFILLALILEKALDCSLQEFCQNALFKHLDINLSDSTFNLSSDAIIHNLFSTDHNLNCSPEDIHKIGKLLINNGFYNGKKIISAGFMREMQTPQKTNPNYGYMWSIYPFGYGIIGKCGQCFIVNPEKKLIYLLLSKDKTNRKEYNGIYAKLLEEYSESI